MQEKANSKIRKFEDKEEGDLTVSNDTHATDDNCCDELVTNSVNKVEGSPKTPEQDDVDGSATDDPRPTKKVKTDEDCCSGKADNGCQNF